ncbi:MAG TPA: GAF domain-containing protein, partial [Candidatus Paceibacterota bacterium]|nr:GAF domain-containing protein [Candidatus Paceibacterota bacterium]
MSSGQKEWLTQIVNSSTSAIIVIDRQRRIKFANKAAAVIAGGGSSEGLIGRSYDEVLQEGEVLEFDGSPADPADFPSTHALREGRMTKGRIYERVHRGRHAWLQTDADPIPDEEGLPAFCILRFRDVSVDKWKSDRLDFLTRSERILSLTTDYHARLIEKARLTIPNLADWCTLNVVNPDGTLSRIAVAHRDPAKEELVRRLAELSERELGHDAGVGRVVKTGEPSFVPDVDPRSMKGNGRSQEMVSLIEQLEVCSSMTLPIISRDSVLGALSVAYAGSKRHYTERDLEFMSEFCLHLGVSVDNARLYEEIHARDKAKDDFLAALSHE